MARRCSYCGKKIFVVAEGNNNKIGELCFCAPLSCPPDFRKKRAEELVYNLLRLKAQLMSVVFVDNRIDLK